MLTLENISKAFSGLPALRGVSLTVRPGEVHGLLGENGAGKSTLMNIVFGLLRADAGRILIHGKPVVIPSPAAARRAGIGMVHQHFKLVPTLSVLDNFVLALGRGVLARRAAVREKLVSLSASLGWQVEPDVLVSRLSVGQQQRLEILKAVASGDGAEAGRSKVLILDEPTAVLTPQEFTELAAAIRRLAKGGTTVIFISHKLAEVRAVCDAVTILRRGEVVHTGPAEGLSTDEMATRMVGVQVEMPLRDRAKGPVATEGGVLLEVQRLTIREGSRQVLRDVSLVVRRGEIVGIAGVDGNGQAPLVRAIVSAMQGTGRGREPGAIRWSSARLALIPEDRQREALVMPLTVTQNMLLKDYRRRPFSVRGWLRLGLWRRHARELVQRYNVRCGSVDEPVSTLSGGNQQKVVIAREMNGGGSQEPQLVIAANPTRGLDVGATAMVMKSLLSACRLGAGVLLVHSDLDELLAIADRVLVMYNGTLRDSGWPEATKEHIGRLMLGASATGEASGAREGGAA